MDQQNLPSIAEQFKQLPTELQQLITSAELPRKISLVAKKYHLDEEQERLLGNEVGLILLVLDSTTSLPKNLIEGLGITPQAALSVSMDISNYIFNEVTEFLVHGDIGEPTDEVKPHLRGGFTSSVEMPEPEPIEEVKIEPTPIPPVIDINLQPWAPLRASAAPGEGAHLNESTAKHDILNHIENPPRTVIKKHTEQYVIEHDIVTDPAKLIDNKVDTVPKLLEIYLD